MSPKINKIPCSGRGVFLGALADHLVAARRGGVAPLAVAMATAWSPSAPAGHWSRVATRLVHPRRRTVGRITHYEPTNSIRFAFSTSGLVWMLLNEEIVKGPK